MKKTFKHLNLEQRLKIKEMRDSGYSVVNIANSLGIARTTIYNELGRTDLQGNYNPYYAQSMYEKNKKHAGIANKLSNTSLAQYISNLILVEHLSPEKIVDLLLVDNKGFPNIPKSPHTIYSAIDKGLIPNVTRDSLLRKHSTVFNNGHICIPRWVLDRLNINDGDVLSFNITESNEIVYKKAEK